MRNFANKYRPKGFDDVIGQDNIVNILSRQIETGNIKNGYLYAGPAGTGKTTMARIMARELNGNLGAGTIEIDAASNTGVDNVRDIIENAKYKSMDSKYKVYIIDEVHMLSTGAFNALLKILEEPPKHVVFIACTTDPQKIPATIMSRLQRFNFGRVAVDVLIERLEYIADKEEIGISPDALKYIASISNGGVRDAVSTLDLCSSMVDGEWISIDTVLELLGKVNAGVYFEFITYTITDKTKAIKLLNDLWEEGVNIKQFMTEMAENLIDYHVYRLTRDKMRLPAGIEVGKITSFKEVIDRELITALVKSILELNREIRYESNPKYIVEGWIIAHDWTR